MYNSHTRLAELGVKRLHRRQCHLPWGQPSMPWGKHNVLLLLLLLKVLLWGDLTRHSRACLQERL